MTTHTVGVSNDLLVPLVRSKVNKPYDMLRELIDNCLDAEATQITIKMNLSVIEISDNGKGISKDRFIDSFTKIGEAFIHDEADYGRYNYGMKAALICLGDSFIIETKTKDESESYTVGLNWKTKPKIFNIIDKDIEHIGTTIRISSPLIKGSDIPKSLNIISKTYKYLIEDYLILISFNGQNVKAAIDVPWTSQKEINGDGYSIIFGTYHSKTKDIYSVSELQHVTQWYKRRRLCSGKNYESIAEIDGNFSIQLFINNDKYTVSILKDEIVEAEDIIEFHAPEIIEFLAIHIDKAMEIQLNSDISKIEAEFASLFNMGQGRRPNSGEKTGTIPPKNTEQKKQNFFNGDDKTLKHNVKNKNKPGTFKINFRECDGIGSVDIVGAHLTVFLDRDKPEVAAILRNASALRYIIAFLISSAKRKGQLFTTEDISVDVLSMVKGLIVSKKQLQEL